MNKALLQDLQTRFSSEFVKCEFHSEILLGQENLLENLTWLKEKLGFFYFLDLSAIDQWGTDYSKRFTLFIWLLNMELHERICVKIDWDDTCKPFCDLSNLYPAAKIYQLELWDMFGIQFQIKKNKRLFNPDSFKGHPLRKDFQDQNDVLNFSLPTSQNSLERLSLKDGLQEKTWYSIGPFLSVGQSMVKMEYTLEKERIQESIFETGFYHRGIEKMAEQTSFESLFFVLNKLNHCSPDLTVLAWAELLEKAAGLSLPERAQALRMVIAEVARIQDHLQCVAMGAFEARLPDVFTQCMKERERLILLMQKLKNKRAQAQLVCVGGLTFDLPLGWMTECLSVSQEVYKSVKNIYQKCIRSRQWVDKTKVGHVRARDALDWGFSGPMLRAAGVNYDLRKVSATYFYHDVDFEVPLGINGDTYDRFLVRLEEIFQSLSIISQVIDHLPPGMVRFTADSPVEQSLAEMMGEGMTYHSIESATGEFGLTLFRSGDACPARLKIRTSSLMSLSALPDVLAGQEVDQALMTLHSFNLVHGEVDK